MAEIRAFRGIRYNEERFGDLSAVLAPPYDVISPADYEALRALSDRNVVRLILRDPLAGQPAAEGPEAYDGAAALLDDWLMDETLVQDIAPAIYLLDQEFVADGERRTRRAFIARLRVEEFGKGHVFPHEQTMPGPKADRLALMKATKVNMCQVFALFRDDGKTKEVLDRMAEVEPIAQGVGTDGVRNVLRAVYHPRLIEKLAGAMAEKRIVVADGHHRYETAVAYRDEMRPLNKVPSFQEPYEFIAAAFVATSDPGLIIRPTHRLVSGIKQFRPDSFFDKARAEFELEDIPDEAGAVLRRLGELSERHALGIVTRAGSRILVRKIGRRELDGSSNRLDTHILHHEILGGLLLLGPEAWEKGGQVKYVQDADECVEAVKGGSAQLAALVNPTRIEEVEAVAFAGGKMPPKSTFFYPKIPTGTVINPLV